MRAFLLLVLLVVVACSGPADNLFGPGLGPGTGQGGDASSTSSGRGGEGGEPSTTTATSGGGGQGGDVSSTSSGRGGEGGEPSTTTASSGGGQGGQVCACGPYQECQPDGSCFGCVPGQGTCGPQVPPNNVECPPNYTPGPGCNYGGFFPNGWTFWCCPEVP